MFRLKIYWTEEKILENLCFDALVNDKKGNVEYEVMYDLNQMYELLLKEGLSGDLSIVYLDIKTVEKKIETINFFECLEEQLIEFRDFMIKWYGLTFDIERLH